MRHYLEGAPLTGPGFFTENVVPLAKEFGINVDTKRTLTKEELFESSVYQAHEHASRIIIQAAQSDLVKKKLAAYKWNKKLLVMYGIGTVESFDIYLDKMLKAGYTREFLQQVDLANP